MRSAQHKRAIETFATALWTRLDHLYAKRPRLRLLVHQFFYNIFEEKQPAVFRSELLLSFRRTNSSLANVYWREMTRAGGSAQQTGVHWSDLEPVEPEPPREDGPRLQEPYINKHRMVKMADRRTVRYRMLPLAKRTRKKKQQQTTSEELVDNIISNKKKKTTFTM